MSDNKTDREAVDAVRACIVKLSEAMCTAKKLGLEITIYDDDQERSGEVYVPKYRFRRNL